MRKAEHKICPKCHDQKRKMSTSHVWQVGENQGIVYYACNYGHSFREQAEEARAHLRIVN